MPPLKLCTPILTITDKQKERLSKLIAELTDHRWERGDLIDHVLEVNRKIQQVIWNGRPMSQSEMVRFFINTLPPEWQDVLNRIWDVNGAASYKKIVMDFVNEYYCIVTKENIKKLNKRGSFPVRVLAWC